MCEGIFVSSEGAGEFNKSSFKAYGYALRKIEGETATDFDNINLIEIESAAKMFSVASKWILISNAKITSGILLKKILHGCGPMVSLLRKICTVKKTQLNYLSKLM